MSKPVIVVIVVAIIAVGAIAAFVLSSGGGRTTSQTSITSITTSVASANPQQSFSQHIQTIETRQVPTIVAEYDSNALVVWTGNTAGLGGTYTGTGNIKLLYSGALGTASSITITPSNIQVSGPSGNQFSVNATLKINGTSGVLGPYNGTITAKVTYTATPSGWVITYEHWNYDSFAITNSGGATTFPEWQKVGEPITSHRSPDWLHNFSWDYGGLGFAVFIWGLVAVVALAAVAEAAQRRSQSRKQGKNL